MPRSRDPLVVGRVVGDVLDPFTRSVSFSVTYNNGVNVNNGCTLRPSQIINQPVVGIGLDGSTSYYTLVMVDPDAPNPSEPRMKEYLHWMVTNIPAGGDVRSQGQEVVPYESPRPTVGIHRLVFVLFRQPHGGRQMIDAPGWRQNFSSRDFAEVYNLGPPVAATYFNCQREFGSTGERRR